MTTEATDAMFSSNSGSTSTVDAPATGGDASWESQPLGGPQSESNSGVAQTPDSNNNAADDANAGGATQQGQATEQPNQQPASAVSPASRQYAKSFGFTDADIDAFPSDAALEQAVTAVGRRILSAQTQTGGQDQNAGQPGQQPQAPQPQSPAQPAANPFKPNLDLSAFDDDTQKVIGGLNDHYASQMGQMFQVAQTMAQKVVMMERVLTQMLDESQMGKLDRFIAGNEQYAQVIGNGNDVRRNLMADARLMAAQLGRTGQAPDPEAIFRAAISARYSDELAKLAKASVHQEIRQAEQRLSNNTAGSGATRNRTVDTKTMDNRERSALREEAVAFVRQRLGQ